MKRFISISLHDIEDFTNNRPCDLKKYIGGLSKNNIVGFCIDSVENAVDKEEKSCGRRFC